MTKPLRFDDEAVEEMDAAAQWYEARRENLGLEFIAEVRQALTSIANLPDTWPIVRAESRARRFVLRRFPYAIVYIHLEAEIRVLAVAHTSREPGFWRTRR
jgi:plasmid stabilization system protein ParE